MLQIVVLISGSGTNLHALIEACQAPDYPVHVLAVGADRSAEGLQFAKQAHIPTFVVPYRAFENREAWSAALLEQLDRYHPDLVVLSGLMRILPPAFVRALEGRLINTHPALLPAFPGAHAVRDALAANVPETGATIHLVDDGVDTGPIIAQTTVQVAADDTEQSLHERIKVVERSLLIDTLRRIADGDIDLPRNHPPQQRSTTCTNANLTVN